MLIVFALLLILTPATAQTAADLGPSTPITLLMDWKRGDLHYGPNFIELRTACANSDENGCECVASFKANPSTGFADYVSSFKHNQVPVVYAVWYGTDGQARLAKFAAVGTWQHDRFGPNDGNITSRHTFWPGKPGEVRRTAFNLPSDCFRGLSPRPAASKTTTSLRADSPVPATTQAVASAAPPPLRVPAKEQEERLIFAPPPEYPPDAEKAGIQGAVTLEILIGKDGNVKEANVISGHPQLAPAAKVAVYQWQYRSVLRDDKPVEVVTNVTVDFRLKGAQ